MKQLKVQEKVLLTIAQHRGWIKTKEIMDSTGFNKNSVDCAVHSDLTNRSLIKLKMTHTPKKDRTPGNPRRLLVGFHPRALRRIKKLLGGHWQEKWEADWKWYAERADGRW